MKTIEEKAKAYDEAIEVAREYWNSPRTCIDINVLPKLFPELKESEDEKIRKDIIDFVKSRGGFKGDWIAWLEKQGEQKHQYKSRPRYVGETELLGEQKPTDKVEPKFKVGDWVVCEAAPKFTAFKTGDVVQIRNKETLKLFLMFEDCIRLWNVTKDAKDGDVLYMDNGLSTCTFIYKSTDNVIIRKYASYNIFGFEGTTYLVLNDGYVCPATKEQRDLLFHKMKEAGYKWDAEKKELKKIEQNPWSEEDEDAIGMAIIALEDMYDEDTPNTTYSGYNLPFNKAAERLKSLKDRYAWKPSESDILLLERIANGKSNPQDFQASLVGLIGQLKKLREK